MKQVDLSVRTRVKASKNGNRRHRRLGELPGVLYGGGKPSQPVLLDGVQFGKMLNVVRSTTIFNLTVEGEKATQPAILREIQRDPVSDARLLHVDFYRISLDKAIEVEVPIHAVGGTPIGVKAGGVLETLTRRITVRCLPLEVPNSIDFDVSGLEMGASIHVSDLKAPEGTQIVTELSTPVFILAAPSGAMVEEATTATPETAAVEGAEGAAAGAAPAAGGAAGAAPAAAAGDKGGDKKDKGGKAPAAKK